MPAHDDQLLQTWLADRDVPCPVCGYNLRDLTTAKCPECAAGLGLQVGSENLHPGPWFVAMLGPALAIGFDGVVAALMTIGMLVSPPPSPYARIRFGVVLAVFALVTLLGIVAEWLLFRRRRAWTRAPRRRQWRYAIVIFAATGLFHAFLGALVWAWLD